MKKGRFTEAQIVSAMKKYESGIVVKDISREMGTSEAIFFNWKAKYGGMEVRHVVKMKQMEAEIGEYKKIVT